MRARRAVGANLHLVRDDLSRQRRNMLDRSWPCTGQSEIERVDAQRFHEMKDFNFLGDRWIAHGRRLQSIAKTFIIEQHRPRRLQSWRIILVPVVDEFGSIHQYLVPSTWYRVSSQPLLLSVLRTRYSQLLFFRRQRQSKN
jgi:hypothetical protein